MQFWSRVSTVIVTFSLFFWDLKCLSIYLEASSRQWMVRLSRGSGVVSARMMNSIIVALYFSRLSFLGMLTATSIIRRSLRSRGCSAR